MTERPPPASLTLHQSEPQHPTASDNPDARSGLLSPDFPYQFHGDSQTTPPPAPPRSAPADMQHFHSPMRHHKRTPSAHREVKETLNAQFKYTNDESDERTHHQINQYTIRDEIGRGSFGAVHVATDQYGHEYAVKEFSKVRLRKRAQSSLLRQGPKRFNNFPGRAGFGAPDTPNVRLSSYKAAEASDSLHLIREEIAIMKKLAHPNLVQLIEVLDDPLEDSLYMVLEMCKKGVVMKVGLNETAEPYKEEDCRCWFRDLILGIEYLHSQGVVHRDIKPDNLLLTEDDVLKIVDFGVSEMFEKDDEMRTAKPAGSPAFLPPELCVAKHGDVSGKAADIWAMGVSLYCLRYGKIPFERDNVLGMYEAIKTETPKFPADENPLFLDLMSKLMEKDPEKRITMPELREHPWVTKNGTDPLLSAEENCADPVDLPNSLELNHAFTRRMSHLICVMKAINKFKSLLKPKDELPAISLEKVDEGSAPQPDVVVDTHPGESNPPQTTTEDEIAQILKQREQFLKLTGGHKRVVSTSRRPLGDVATERTDSLLLGIGTGGINDFSTETPPDNVVAESPTAVDFNIFERAYGAEVDRIKRSGSRKRGGQPGQVYRTRFNERGSSQFSASTATDDGSTDDSTPRSSASVMSVKSSRFADLVSKARAAQVGVSQEGGSQ
ncbi:kinase-like domain-containing protein [Podospora conica]|nr:kinase-like domain-containing protein [Schizothecium conicum]